MTLKPFDTLATPDQIAAAVLKGKKEILADIASGRVPATVNTFSQLHDYVDANEYGGLFEPPFYVVDRFGRDADGNIDTDGSNAVQNQLHAWLDAGLPVPFKVVVTFTVESAGTTKDIAEALDARLSEFYPIDNEVAIPTIQSIEVESVAL